MSHTYRRTGARRRPRGPVLLLTGFTLAMALAWQLGRLALRMWAEQHTTGPLWPDEIFGLLAATVGCAVSIWLATALVVSTVAALGARSRIAGPAARTADWVAPTALRNGVAALLGLALVTVPATAQAATASNGNHRSTTVSRLVAEPSLQTMTSRPRTEHHSSAGLRPTGSTTTRPDASARPSGDDLLLSLSPGWAPERPRPSGSTSVLNHGRLDVKSRKTDQKNNIGPTPRPYTVVRHGDTLWSIAARHLGPDATTTQIATEWPRWYQANRHLIGADPHRILPGERLRAPRSTDRKEAGQ